MAVVTYYPEVACLVEPGFLENTYTVSVRDATGNSHYLQAGKNTVAKLNGKTYLPIGIVKIDYALEKALVELPQEADSGASRLWVPFASLRRDADES